MHDRYKEIIEPWPQWIDTSDVVLWNKVEIARNIAGYKFPVRADAKKLDELFSMLKQPVMDLFIDGHLIELADTDDRLRKYLRERFLIDSFMISHPISSAVAVDRELKNGVDINSTSHLNFFSIISGNVQEEEIQELVMRTEEIGQNFPYAYSEKFGYLTPFIEDCGTGMSIKYYMRLPGFLLLGKFTELREIIEEENLSMVPHSFGEMNLLGTGIFSISNSRTFGMNIETLLEDMQATVGEIVEREREFREKIRAESSESFEDKIMKTIGMLKYSSSLGNTDFGKAIFTIMLGIEIGLLPLTMDELLRTYFSLGTSYLDLDIPPDDQDMIKKVRAKSLQKLLQNI